MQLQLFCGRTAKAAVITYKAKGKCGSGNEWPGKMIVVFDLDTHCEAAFGKTVWNEIITEFALIAHSNSFLKLIQFMKGLEANVSDKSFLILDLIMVNEKHLDKVLDLADTCHVFEEKAAWTLARCCNQANIARINVAKLFLKYVRV